MNNIAYIDLMKQVQKEAINVIMCYPMAYIKGLIASFYTYFRPSTNWFINGGVEYSQNLERIKNLDRAFNILLCGQILPLESQPVLEKKITLLKSQNTFKYYIYMLLSTGLWLLIGIPFLVLYGLYSGIKTLLTKPANIRHGFTVLFLVINVAYVCFIGNFFEVVENNRFRFMTDSFIMVILGVFANNVLKKIKNTSLYFKPRG
jgi:hypothetical protein